MRSQRTPSGTRRSLPRKLSDTHDEHPARHADTMGGRLHRRMQPQAVPRGFLRMYMLGLTTRQAETGYSIMQHINERTTGHWRPGPGTIYPLLKILSKEGLVEPLDLGGREDSAAYQATEKGRKELEETKAMMFSAGSEEKPQVMMALIAELFRPEQYISFFFKHYRAEFELFEEKSVQLPLAEREPVLAEMESILQREISWIRSRRGQQKKTT